MSKFQINFVELLANKQAKEGKVITITEVAERTGLAYTTLKRWAGGDIERVDFPIVQKLCDFFDCSMEELVSYRPQVSQKPMAISSTALTAV